MAISEKQKQYVIDYKARNIKRVPFDMQKTEYERLAAGASAVGESVNGFIKKAINERLAALNL